MITIIFVVFGLFSNKYDGIIFITLSFFVILYSFPYCVFKMFLILTIYFYSRSHSAVSISQRASNPALPCPPQLVQHYAPDHRRRGASEADGPGDRSAAPHPRLSLCPEPPRSASSKLQPQSSRGGFSFHSLDCEKLS